MNALVKELVLLGGWLAFAAFGYYAVSRLGEFLDRSQAGAETAYEPPEEQGDLNIAAASPWAMQAGSQVLKAMQREHPYLHCTLSMGEEPELLELKRVYGAQAARRFPPVPQLRSRGAAKTEDETEFLI